MMVKTVVDSGRYCASNIVPAPIQFPLDNTPGKVDSIMNCIFSAHEYFLYLFSKQFLYAFIAVANLLEGKILSEGHLGSCLNKYHGTNN